MQELSNALSDLTICKTLALAIPDFYSKTGISATIIFRYNSKEKGMEINLGFHPKEPNNEEYEILFSSVRDAEIILRNDYILNEAKNFEFLNQLVFKHSQEMKKIIEKRKENV